MCNPAAAFWVASAVLTVGAGMYQADATKKAGEAQVEVARRNEATEKQKAELANEIGRIEEEKHRAQVRQMLGSQRATMAANGLDLSSGTALAITDQTAAFGETDAATIRYNAAREAWGYGVSATNFATEAAVTKAGTKNAVMGTYLTTAANVAGSGYSAYGAGTFSKKKAG